MITQTEGEQIDWFPPLVPFPDEHFRPGDDVGAWARTHWISAPIERVHEGLSMRRHRSGCAECAAAIDEDLARERARKAYIRGGLTQDGQQLADRCWSIGLKRGQDGSLRVPASWPLPAWLHEVLAAGDVQGPQSEWPELCEVTSDVDWATLLAEHPDDAVMVDGVMEPGTVSWAAVAQAKDLLVAADLQPTTFVSLDVQPDGRIGVWPWLLCTDRWEGDTVLAATVARALAAGGRELSAIAGPPEKGPWQHGADWQVSG